MIPTKAPSFENLDGEPYLIIVLSPFAPYPAVITPASSGRELLSRVRAINARFGSDLLEHAIALRLEAMIEATHKENVGIDEALLPIFNSHFQAHNANAPIEGLLSFTRTVKDRFNDTVYTATIVAGPIDMVNEYFTYLNGLDHVL